MSDERMSKFSFIFILVLLAFAPSFEAAAEEITIEQAEVRANEGDVQAQFLLGVAYLQGRGVQQDYDAAAKWFRKAADQKMPEAQANLAVFYMNGWGVERDLKKALFWNRKAAAQGFAAAPS